MCFQGVANMAALGNVISWQKLEYDFEFHRQPFDTDIAVLVLSEGKSLLKVCCGKSVPEISLFIRPHCSTTYVDAACCYE